MKHLYLVDNSVTQRVHREPSVKHALVELLATGELATCLPLVLEEGYSARSADEHATLMRMNRAAKVMLAPSDDVAEQAIDLQCRLFEDGTGRAAGVSDLQIAATALAHSTADQAVTVVHYDADFEHIAHVCPQFQHRWIVARGSVS